MTNEPPYLRDLGASCDTRHIGASLTEGEITFWRSGKDEPIVRCNPGFSGGASRYQIDPVRGVVYSGTWENGVTCYDYQSQKVLWHRKDIIGIQTVNLSTRLPESVFLTIEAPDYRRWFQKPVSGIAELDAKTGKTKWLKPLGDWLWVHPHKPVLVATDRGRNDVVRIYDADRKELGKTKMVNFAVIDMAFSDDLIALAEGKKGVRIIDYKGRLVSSYAPVDREPNCTSLAFADGRLHVHDSWEGAFIFTLDPVSGQLISVYKRPAGGEVCFINDGSGFVNRRGEIYRSSDATLESSLLP